MSDAAVIGLGPPGWFGKMPSVGDFASRRLPDAFVRRWDAWLQRGLALGRAELGEAWLAGYLVAPIRRFWIAPGLLGRGGWGGVLMPSVDRVGRHFPLTIVQPVRTLAAALAAVDWYRELDAAARRVLDMEFTIDDLEDALAAIPRADDEAADEAASELARRLLSGLPAGRASVWWCDDAGAQASFQCFDALPPAAALAAMMAGGTLP
ncbi:type VI secretion system-associated protein TagF [Piscinibacter sp. XHJ-5]|uniref:type VI secretion system-associated protein TagF n=1 Tax=Piscinibacter sp. XHJ-5 TaxID=3037797 RepID=UPI0024530AAB|nr:type VI secretion system-associated protein TagF [Piscinibacter sp. XHJ-5]